MRIQHNIMAMNAYRNYTNNVSAMKSNLEKLSSGYKINRAGDDAAGLAISEKMRAQITGLETAQKNAKDGISLVQTAEGALTEVHDMLNRMVTLATQSANGTYANEVDREQLQIEIVQLKSEIDRIADSANFNGIKLLDGSMSTEESFQAGKATMDLGTVKAGNFIDQTTCTGASSDSKAETVCHKDAAESGKTEFSIDLDGLNYDSITTAGNGATINIAIGAATTVTISALGGTTDLDAAGIAKKIADSNSEVSIGGVSYSIEADGSKLKFTMTDASQAASTQAGSFTGNFAVSVTLDSTTSATLGNNGNVNHGTVDVNEGIPNAGEILANTKQTTAWGASDIKDGMVLEVGDEKYIIALTDQMFENASAVQNVDSSYKVVDVRSFATDKSADAGKGTVKSSNFNTGAGESQDTVLSGILTKISETAKDNKMWSVGVTKDGTSAKLTFQEKSTYDGENKLDTVKKIEDTINVYDSAAINVESASKTVKGKALTLQIGDTAEEWNQLKVGISDCHVAAMGIGGIDISTQEGAIEAMEKIKSAVNYVSDVRGTLGATQNRLDHTINNLSVMTENIQDAESTIRDVDIAEEMMAYTKNNILIQSAQAMLAQANQIPQGVLQLLG